MGIGEPCFINYNNTMNKPLNPEEIPEYINTTCELLGFYFHAIKEMLIREARLNNKNITCFGEVFNFISALESYIKTGETTEHGAGFLVPYLHSPQVRKLIASQCQNKLSSGDLDALKEYIYK